MVFLSAKVDVSDDVKETIKSIKKINYAFLPKTADNTVNYEAEKAKLKVFYTGDTDAIDEVIAFGYGDKNGVGVARLLGEMMNSAKMEGNSKVLENFMKGFSGI